MYSLNDMVALRREIHSFPEPGWCEFVTTSKIIERLKAMGVEPLVGKQIINPEFIAGRNPAAVQAALAAAQAKGVSQELLDKMEGYTGAVAVFKTGRPGPVIAVRFDIDCVEVTEAQEPQHRPFAEGWSSQNPGRMHSCGHDGHLTMGVGLCSWIAENLDKLCGTIKVLFQPAEEGVRGARPIAESGVLDDVDFLFGNHLGLGVDTGIISAVPGEFLATTKLDATFTGVAAHAGANPEKGKNALLAAATAALAIHALPRPIGPVSALNVGTLRAGEGRNVLPPNAFMQLEVRGESEEVNALMREEAIRRLQGAADMYGCELKIDKAGEATEFNPDPEAIAIAEEAAVKTVGAENVQHLDLKLGSEDATILLRRVQSHGGKGTFIVFGSTIKAGHHQRLFDYDEEVLSIAVNFYKNLLTKTNGI